MLASQGDSVLCESNRICSTTWRFMLLSTWMIAFFLSLSILCMCVFLTEVACLQMSHE